jgi:hypothetical protein
MVVLLLASVLWRPRAGEPDPLKLYSSIHHHKLHKKSSVIEVGFDLLCNIMIASA